MAIMPQEKYMTNRGYVVVEVRPETRQRMKKLKGATWNYDRLLIELMDFTEGPK